MGLEKLTNFLENFKNDFFRLIKYCDEVNRLVRLLLELLIAFLLACIPYALQQYLGVDGDYPYLIYGIIILIIFALVLCIITTFAPIYNKEMRQIPVLFKNYRDDSKNHHIIIKNHILDMVIFENTNENDNKEYKLEKKPFLDCKVIETKNIFNNQANLFYETHIYNMQSDEGISELSDGVRYFRDGVPLDISDAHKSCSICTKTIGIDSCKEEQLHVTIPVCIPPKESIELKIYECHCPAFSETLGKLIDDNIKQTDDDSIQLKVHYPTEVLRISIRLDTNIAKKYKFIIKANYTHYVNGIKSLKQLSANNYFVLDQSEQRIIAYENLLRQWDAIPHLSSDQKSLEWEIHTPRIGYLYEMWFNLEKIV